MADENPEIVLVGWGSTYGVIKEVVDNFKFQMFKFQIFSGYASFQRDLSVSFNRYI